MKASGLFLIACVVAFAVAEDQCGQFPTCETCLSNAFCGWCSPSSVQYQNGTYGARCADQRDDEWNCYHLYQTTQCIAGYACDMKSGQCKLTDPGEGDTKENCELHCNPPEKTYRCNSDTGTCDECPDYDPTCSSDQDACDSSCEQEKHFTCNEDTLKCEEDPYGTKENTCDAHCNPNTPSELVGIWRGIMVQSGMSLGEWAFKFTTDSVTVLSVDTGAAWHGSVGEAFDKLVITFSDGPFQGQTLKGIVNQVHNGPETKSSAFSFGAAGKNAPSSVDAAMYGSGFTVFVMSQCNSWSGSCDFSSVFEGVTEVLRSSRYLLPADVKGSVHDDCNEFLSCETCLAAPSGLCGWCTEPVVYKNDSSITGVQCAGFNHDGSVPEFTCVPEYRRVSCQDWVCDWSGAEPECRETKDGESGRPKQQACQWCESSKLYKCNTDTKTCEECSASDKGCLASANCDVVCGKDYSYCDHATWTCATTSYDDPRVTTQPCDDTCAAPVYYTCDYSTGTCSGGCSIGEPGCNTEAYCDAVCKPSDIAGVWRGIKIGKDFDAGEYDFAFFADGTVAWTNRDGDKHDQVYRGTWTEGGASSSEEAVTVTIEVTSGPDSDMAGKSLKGLYKSAAAYGPPVDFMYLAVGEAGADGPSTFDAGMAEGQQWTLTKCQDGEENCDFSIAEEDLKQ